MNSVQISSPAKVNLFLKVLGKRRDGYHNLFTLFHRISLTDTLVLQKIPSGIRLRTNIPSLPSGSKNLIWKAFHLLQERKPFPGGVSVTLQKKIPVGAGLGGGSSNAASFLLGIKRLYRLKISSKELQEIGSKLGADVNFFLRDVNQAIGYGKGEKLRSFPTRKPLWFILVIFPRSLSTAKVYRLYRKKRERGAFPVPLDSLTKENPVVKLPQCFQTGDVEKLAPFLENDLQKTSIRLYPAIERALRLFQKLGVSARLMSGSGPTVFAVLESGGEARTLAKAAWTHLRSYKKIFISHTL